MSFLHDKPIAPRGRPLGLVLAVWYKGLWGMSEVVAGTLLAGGVLLLGSVERVAFIQRLVAEELAEDPQDRLAHLFLITGTRLDIRHTLALAAVVVLLGLIKIALAIGIWYRSWTVRNAAIAIFFGGALVAGYELLAHFSFVKFFAAVADIVLLYYVWRVLPRYLPPHKK